MLIEGEGSDIISIPGQAIGGSLPVLTAHSFASNWELALLESAEEENLSRKNVLDAMFDRLG